MDFKDLSHRISAVSLARRIFLRAFMIGSAISIVSLMQILSGSEPVLFNSNSVGSVGCGDPFMKGIVDVNATVDVARKLIGMKILDYGAKSLCVGEGSACAVHALQQMGFVNVRGFPRQVFFPGQFFFPVEHRRMFKEVTYLAYEDKSFDFVLSGNWNKLSVHPVLVRELERVLKPGGIGAVLVDTTSTNAVDDPIRYAYPVSVSLKNSTIVHFAYLHEFVLVVFRKKTDTVTYFENFQLPSVCHSVDTTKSLVGYLEPITQNKPTEFAKKIVYLPKFIDVRSEKPPVFVEIGVGSKRSFNGSTRLLSSYLIDNKALNEKAFQVYVVDHDASLLLHSLKCPEFTFVYYPGLVGDETLPNQDGDDGLNSYPDNEEFDLAMWFKGIVQHAGFVILKINAGELELKFLADLFEDGTICSVDELFMACPDYKGGKGVPKGECMDILRNLRSAGIYAHQWWDE